MNGEKFNSDRAPQAVGLYPHARKVGDLLFLSGVGPRKAGQTEIPGVTLNASGEIENYDIEAQCHSVFENIRFILEDAGSSWEKIVDVQVFLTNMKDDFKTYRFRFSTLESSSIGSFHYASTTTSDYIISSIS